MTLISRAGRFAGLTVMIGMLLAGCSKGPDRTQVAADLQKGIQDYLAQMEGPQANRVINHASVKVSPQQDAGYLVAIDGVKIGEAGDYLDVGTISYVLTPKDDKTYDASQLTIANDMPIKTSDGQPGGDLKLTNKAFTGTWMRDAQAFSKFDLELADLALVDPKDNGTVKAATAVLANDSTDKGNGVWDQTGKLTITNIDVADQTEGHLTIKEVDATSAIQGLKLLDYTTKLRAVREAMAKAAPAAAAPATTPAAPSTTTDGSTTTADSSTTAPATPADPATVASDAAIRDFATALPSLMTGFTSDFHLSGISYQATDQSSSFDLGKAGFALAATGFDQPKAAVKLSVDHDALSIHAAEAQSDLVQALLPANGALIFSLNDVPTKDLASLFADAAVTFGRSDPAAMEMQTAALYGKLLSLLQQDGVSLKVEPSHLTAPATNIDATGQFAIQAGAMHGAVGALDVGITGLDQVTAMAQKAADQDPEAAQILGAVQTLMTYAAREQGSDGKPVDKFKLDVPQTGEMTVNGKALPF